MGKNTSSDKLRGFNPHGTARAESLAGVPLASFQSRAFAFVLDLALVLLFYYPAVLGVRRLIAQASRPGHVQLHFDEEPFGMLFILVYFSLSLYFGGGRTVGKRIFKLRVLSLVQDDITLWQAIERALGYGASVLEGGFGFIQYFIHPNHCCVHDRIAETIVVKER